jgi:16S rRNA (cytidine1402-2'-O)-methyltransferase
MSEGIEFFKENNPRGEFVIVVEGDSGNNLKDISGDISSDSIKNEIKRYMEEGYTKKDSVKMVSKDLNISKNIVYKESIEI